jgi:acetoin utilization deacetylase AcuC-like enzyme
MRTGIWVSPLYKKHVGPPGKFECSERYEVIFKMLEDSQLIKRVVLKEGRTCTDEELLRCHSKQHVERISSLKLSNIGIII